MTKANMIQELANAGMQIFGERKMLKADVERYYNTRFTKEENTMTTQNTAIEVTSTNPETTEARVATTEAVSLFQNLAEQFGWKLWIPRKCDGIVAKENKDRVLELYWTAKGFDLYMRNDLFEDIAALVEEHAIPVEHKFRKGWDMQNRYSVTEANAIAFLDMLATL